ncbi:rhomboid-like protein [Streptomyces sp. NPDC048636]|uniref:rhomboid-like protein n=1 Tax=Streptomyces sp. NPDC048636 TaxID=3155762 RepID=UPI0034217912
MRGRPLDAVRAYPSRSPVTFGYVCLLLLTHAWVTWVLTEDRAQTLLGYVSTDLDNLADHPAVALLGSALFFDGTLTDITSLLFPATVITLGFGVCCCLSWAERRWGALRAFVVFFTAHIATTLLTAGVIILALRQGWYPDEVRHTLDYGISYGAQTVMAASTVAMPRWARIPWAVFLIAWPIAGAEWPGPLPDFTAVGHVLAAALGFLLALPSVAHRLSRGAPRPLGHRPGHNNATRRKTAAPAARES